MSAHFEVVEADFQAVYAIDLRDALFGAARVGVRRLLSLVKGLPPWTATFQILEEEREIAEKKTPEHMAKVLGGAIRFTGKKEQKD